MMSKSSKTSKPSEKGELSALRPVSSLEELAALEAESPALLVLYGGPACGVCQAIKSRIEAMLAESFPAMRGVYVDCQGEGQSVCAQRQVFSLPVIRLWFDGRPFDEFVRAFSLAALHRAIERPYARGTPPPAY